MPLIIHDLHYSTMNVVSQLHMKECEQIQIDLANGRKQEIWDDVTKLFPFHKATTAMNSLDSFIFKEKHD